MAKQWKLKPRVPSELAERFPEIDPLLLQLLYARGLTDQSAIDVFLEPEYSRDLADPFQFRQMKTAVMRIERSIMNHEPMVIYGDYDADGVCSSAVLSETIRALGGQADVYIPFRETEGYGLNERAVEELAKKGRRLIVTVDCGTTNVREVELAAKRGVEVIITDHHDEPEQLPHPLAIINPELSHEAFPFRHLAASGVAFKLATALLRSTEYGRTLGRKPLPVGWEKWLLDLVAISTVTDMVPLLGENRVFVRFGLEVLRRGRRIGLRELFAQMRTSMELADEETLAFQVGPRLNAAGRMNHASTAYQLLVTNDQTEARRLASELSAANTERQKSTDLVVAEAIEQLGARPSQYFLSVYADHWPAGVIGLAAGKLCDRFNRPAIVMTKTKNSIIGSGRSIDVFDVTDALAKAAVLFDRFGGHPQACGFTLKDRVDPGQVADALEPLAKAKLAGVDLTPTLFIDAEVVLEDINWELIRDVGRLAPFGVEAERPRFLSRGVTVVAVDTVGKNGQHLRLHVRHATSAVRKTIGFRFGSWIEDLHPGDTLDIVFEAGMNEWNGSQEIELKIIDLNHARS